jgi:Spy/CpxP family protein refolding chaperone
MVRFSSKFLAVVTAVAVVAMAAQLAVAQNEQGKRGGGRGRGGPGGPGGMGGPPSMARLAMIDKVQDALKITDEQKTKIEKINADFRKEMSGDRPDPEKMKKMRDDVTGKLKEVLNADQQKRLMGIFVQVMGSGAVMDPAVGKEIDLTDEQKDKLHEAMGPPPEGREGRGGGGQSFQDRKAKMDKEVMAVLTPEQQKKLESLKGEKVDIDMSALRGPGGGREGRGRDRGNRGEPKASKSSS